MKTLSGVVVPLITPRHLPDLFPLIDHILAGGISNLFILGTTGEALKLTQKFRIEWIEKIAAYVGSRAHLLVGVTCSHLTDSIELMNISHAAGARACVVTPSISNGNLSTVLDELLSSTRGDLLLYNNPSLTEGASLPIDFIADCMGEKRILGIKDSSGDLEYLDQLIRARGKHPFSVFYGREHGLQEALTRDIQGIVSACGNVEPELVCKLWKGKDDELWKVWSELKAQVKEQNPSNYLAGLKSLLKKRGMITDALLW